MCPFTAPAAFHRHRRLALDSGGPCPVRGGLAFVREALRSWHLADSPPTTDDIVLVAAELLSNAVRHGGGPRDLDLTRHGDRLRVRVTDRSPEPPRLGTRRPGQIGGHGLVIVDRLAVRWGCYPDGGGKAVWADLPLPPERRSPPPPRLPPPR
ncbi:ATP-binding protein [Streptomyces sp. CB01881]|uniref:ATP-binding protein n=1 Tax=Streptomyces sp. CB01881 TaxID=2078691 RepID=UPI000CDC8790|nr:ATP-binding protein [Streptomyces sp. CB01881]AUY47790.1 ATP-binding protein [Streptomyces sp. CB01881]TYC76266.1 ATP-binding protein [Streptomyces sp. CB01881]